MDTETRPRVRIVTRRYCGYCVAAEQVEGRHGIPFEHVDMTGDRAGLEALKRRTGHPTVPQVFLDGTLLGGYTELRAYVDRHGPDALR